MTLNALKPQVTAILENNSLEKQAKLQGVCDLLQKSVPYYNWVGFYFRNGNKSELLLHQFAGKPTDHTVIPFGRGICGQVAISNKTFVVPDVTKQDNYISCSIDVKSEIVVPLFANGKNIGQIDIDSNTPDPFSKEDEHFLEWVNENISKILE